MLTAETADDLDLVGRIAAGVVDPEIPVLTIADLGVLRGVRLEAGRVVVTITPTYSGCPALVRIEEDLRAALYDAGFHDVVVELTHNPAWSTDWITPEGRRRLTEFGIAPPLPLDEVTCVRCNQGPPKMLARFGSTACKALLACTSCGEPFEYFKEF
jgi:ring-1,2-phenylacetyl-CoA epoxidase subunit PaaD